MRYVGGKVRQAKWIKAEICRLKGDRSTYVEPFVGGGAVLAALAPAFPTVIASDIVPDLVMLHEACARGWVPPSTMSVDQYNELKHSPPSPMRAWAAYAASYNGKYFGGYGPTASGRDYLAESQRAMIRKSLNYRHASFLTGSYEMHTYGFGSVIYCDPPYADTERYAGAGDFDHVSFWQWCDERCASGALVFVTEYTAPKHWQELSSVDRVQTMDHSGPSSGARREILFYREPPACPPLPKLVL